MSAFGTVAAQFPPFCVQGVVFKLVFHASPPKFPDTNHRVRDEMINRILFGLDIGRSDYFCPLRGLVGNEFTELGRSHWHRIAANVG